MSTDTIAIIGVIVTLSLAVLGTLGWGYARIDRRFDKIDERFEKVDARFEKVDEQFDKVDARFEKVAEQFVKVDERFRELQQELGEVKVSVARLEGPQRGLITAR